MGHATVRIGKKTRDILRALADAEGKSMGTVLEEAVEAHRRLLFLHAVNDAYSTLRENPVEWTGVESERREWDDSVLDGLAARAE